MPHPHPAPEKVKSATITNHFGLEFEKIISHRNHMIIERSSFTKSFVFKTFPVQTTLTKSRRFQIPPV